MDPLEEAIERSGVLDEPVDPESEAYEPELEEDLLGEEELDDLVAPVALYPDALLAQVLVAATYPLEVVKADRFLEANAEMPEAELVAEVEAQDWDPSVQVLAGGFPTVVERMAEDLEWTEELGLAMLRQDEDVLSAVQRMRLRAEDTGYLASNDAQVVTRDGDQVTIEPADPEVIYVPRYDSAAAFTSAPTAPPVIVAPQGNRFSATNPLVTGAIGFGAGLLVSELLFKDDDDDDENWEDYWRRPRPIDWRQREFYPRPYRYRDGDDRGRDRRFVWRSDDERRRAERRWLAARDSRLDQDDRAVIRRWEERWEERRREGRQDERAEDRQKAERREDREEARTEERRAAARRAEREEERREAAREEERREAARKKERAAARGDAQDERLKAERQDERREAARRAEREEERRNAASQEDRRKASREEARRAAAQEEKRRAAAKANERKRAAAAASANRAPEPQKAKAPDAKAEAEEVPKKKKKKKKEDDG